MVTVIAVFAAVILSGCFFKNDSTAVVSKEEEKNITSSLDGQVKKGFAVASGEFIYYCNPEDNNKLYKIKKDKTSKQKIGDDISDFLILRGNRIFYINKADGSKIYGIDIDGRNRKAITNDIASSMILDRETIYYSNRSNNDRLFSISIEGKNNIKLNDETTMFINKVDNQIIYKNGVNNIVKIKEDGSERKVINEDKTSQVVVFKDKVYYSLQTEDYKLYSMTLEGKDKKKLSEGDSYLTVANEDNIYFLSSNGKNISFSFEHIYKLGIEEKTTKDITVGAASSFCFSDDTMFYKSSAEGDRIYKISTSGNNWDAIDGRAKAFSVEEMLQGYNDKIDFDISDEKLKQTFEKAKEIVETIIKPGMSELEKTLAVHDYLLKNATYDNETYDALKNNFVINLDSHSAYSILVNGKGVCDGYAYALKLLLGISGVESHLISGSSLQEPEEKDKNLRPIYHAWNSVKIDGSYYNMDITWDDGIYDQTGMMSYRYFNISDELMEEDHKWDKNSFLNSKDKKYDYFYNMIHAYRDNNYIVYSNEAKKNRLYKINIDGSGVKELNKDTSLFMIARDGWAYYSNYDDGGALHKVSLDGKVDKVISSDWCIETSINGDWIEYLNNRDKVRYRIKLDGSSKQRIAS
jgi:hypothetical protein